MRGNGLKQKLDERRRRVRVGNDDGDDMDCVAGRDIVRRKGSVYPFWSLLFDILRLFTFFSSKCREEGLLEYHFAFICRCKHYDTREREGNRTLVGYRSLPRHLRTEEEK